MIYVYSSCQLTQASLLERNCNNEKKKIEKVKWFQDEMQSSHSIYQCLENSIRFRSNFYSCYIFLLVTHTKHTTEPIRSAWVICGADSR